MTDPTREEALAHFGVKGMKWGVRKSEPEVSTKRAKRFSKKKIAVGVGASALVVGAATAAVILNKQGKLPLKTLSRKSTPNLDEWRSYKPSDFGVKGDIPKSFFDPTQTRQRGAQAAKDLSGTAAFKKLLKDMEADLADAHKEETIWMRKSVPGYNPRLNPYVPKSELKRINNR